MISISSPLARSTVTVPFVVNATCDSNHPVTVTIKGTNPLLQQTAPPEVKTGNLYFTFYTCPSGTYDIEVKCGDPSESTTVSSVTVQQPTTGD